MSVTNMNMNAMSTEPVTTLMTHVLIDGKEILPHALQNEDVTKGVLMSWTKSGYHSYVGSPAVPGASGTTILNRIPSIPCFSGMEQEKDTVWFEQWLHAISDAKKNFNGQLVRVAINKSCLGDTADAIFCPLPRATLDDIIKKFKWLYRSVESFDTFMQEFYRIVQGKNERIQTFVLHLERALKAIKQQHPYAMTEEEGVKYLKDYLFHGLKPNICSALHYI